MSGERRLFLGGRVTPVITSVIPWPIPAVREGLSRCSMVQTRLYKDLVRLLQFYENISRQVHQCGEEVSNIDPQRTFPGQDSGPTGDQTGQVYEGSIRPGVRHGIGDPESTEVNALDLWLSRLTPIV